MDAWAMKLVAAVVLTACMALGGRAFSNREQRRVSVLSSIERALPMLQIDMLERLMPLGSALRQSGQPLFVHIADAMSEGRGGREAWLFEKDGLTARGQMLDCLLPEDIGRLDLFFESLGASGLSAQRILLSESEKAFALLREQATKRAEERGKLYTNLGMLAGLAISVCLL